MENKELIRELQEQRRNLNADIESRVAARDGLDAFLKYLAASEGSGEQAFSFPGFQVPSVARPAARPRAFGSEKPPTTNGRPEKFVLAREVRNTVLEIEAEEFTQRDITDRIAEEYPDQNVRSASVYNALTRMASRGEVEKARDGSGSDPALFRKLRHATPLRKTPDTEVDIVSN